MAGSEGADVVVVGGGIMGASIAYHLVQAGVSVVLLEQAEAPATGSTGLSAAGVRVQFSNEANIRLSWTSICEYRQFGERYGHPSGYRPIGYLFLVPHGQWDAHLEGVATQRRVDVPVEVLSPDQARERVPFVGEDIAGATFGPADGVIDPHSVTQAYLGWARSGGGSVRFSTPLVAATPEGGGWVVEVPGGRLRAGHVVNAAGPWSGEVAARAGLEVPVQPVRRMIFLSGPGATRRTLPLTVDVASGVYCRSEGDRVLFGRPRPDQEPGFVHGMDWEWFETTLEAASARFPWFADLELDTRSSWYGFYEVTPDHNAILGEMTAAPGWVNACGFSGHGVQQAPAVGRVITEEITRGRAGSIDIDSLRVERFAAGLGEGERIVV